MHALVPAPDVGAVRETFFANQLRAAGYDIKSPEQGDFVIDVLAERGRPLWGGAYAGAHQVGGPPLRGGPASSTHQLLSDDVPACVPARGEEEF